MNVSIVKTNPREKTFRSTDGEYKYKTGVFNVKLVLTMPDGDQINVAERWGITDTPRWMRRASEIMANCDVAPSWHFAHRVCELCMRHAHKREFTMTPHEIEHLVAQCVAEKFNGVWREPRTKKKKDKPIMRAYSSTRSK